MVQRSACSTTNVPSDKVRLSEPVWMGKIYFHYICQLVNNLLTPICRFLFGACCQLQGTVDAPLIVQQELYHQSAAAQSYETYGNQQQNRPSVTVSQNSVEESSNYAERPGLQSHNRPSNLGFVQESYGVVSTEDESNNNIDEPLDQYNNRFGQHPNVVVVDNDSVSVSSPSPEYASSPGFPIGSSPQYASSPAFSSGSAFNAPSSTEHYYSTVADTFINTALSHKDELPTQITTGPYAESSGLGEVYGSGPDSYSEFADQIMHIQSGDFTHSGITHPGVDAVIVDKDSTGYGGPSNGLSSPSGQEYTQTTWPTPEPSKASSTTTERTFKITHAKPAFRPKPTKIVQISTPDSDKYVLIQTINHDVPVKIDKPTKQQGVMSDNDIESIESIILMLNDTKTGPQYNSDSSTAAQGTTLNYGGNTATIYGVQGTTSQQQQHPSTASIDYTKYGPSSHYVTEKMTASSPKPPSTSYVYSPLPTRRPIQVQSTISSSYGAVNQDINPEHLNIPSSSEGLYSSEAELITKRPVIVTTSSLISNPKLPSTSHVTGVATSVRPLVQDVTVTTAGTKKPSTKRPSSSLSSTSQQKITEATTIKLPSTSYIHPSTTPPKRTKPTNKVNPNRKNTTEAGRPTYNIGSPTEASTILYEEVVQTKPSEHYTYAIPTSERPSPTVHITPKPTSNQVTSSFWASQSPTHLNYYTTPTVNAPSSSYIYHPITTVRPNYDYSTPSYTTPFGSSVIYNSSPTKLNTPTNDFDDPGYHGQSVTLRPSISNHGSSLPPSPPQHSFYGPTPTFGPEVQQFVEYSTLQDEIDTSQNDLNNFPPVRNPNLNTTSNVVQTQVSEFDISTPTFVEDDKLNDKMGVLVSKIVESLQGNFEQLADVVYDDVIQQDPITGKPISNTKRPSGTTKKPAAVTKKPVSLAARPANTTKATVRPSTATTKKPAVVRVTSTTKKPATATPAKRTTKKPTAATTVSTKKPVVTKVS